jgi:long-chain acyl-CoA synthetase
MNDRHLGDMIAERCRRFAGQPAMHHKTADRWQAISYDAMGRSIDALAGALVGLEVAPGARVGIFSANRWEWAVADFAIQRAGAVCVPIYATNTARQAEFIVRDAGIELLFVGDEAQLRKVRPLMGANSPLRHLATFDPVEDPGSGATALVFRDLAAQAPDDARREELARRGSAVALDDVATIIYTSGTTGDPKGVMLTHGNFFHQLAAIDAHFQVGPADRSICFLPLSHVYERTWSYVVFSHGAQNFYVADPREVIAAFREVRPTAMVSVPRLYEKIYATILGRLESAPPLRRRLFQWAIGVGRARAEAARAGKPPGPGLTLRHRLADRLVLHKVREVVGGDKNFFSAGGAPLAKEIEEFFLACGLLICQGYGLTETSPMITYNTPQAFKFGTVGRPVPGCEVRIGEHGEIQVRGPNVMRGYHNNPRATAEAFVDGWFRTGDVGHFDDEGFLVITDRIKDLIITSGGKNIAPQHIETTIGKDLYIEQIAAVGDRRHFVSALIVPAFEELEKFARQRGIPFRSRADLVRHPEVIAFYRQRIDAQSAELARYETVKRFTLLPEAFSQEGGEVTPTQKIRRKVVQEKYRETIEAMYRQE